MHPNLILYLAMFLLLYSCSTKNYNYILSDNNQEIEYLESLAIQAIKDKRLTTPEKNSAFLFYKKILALDPNHRGAIEGVSNLSEIYLSWAIRSIESLNFVKAKQHIEKAKVLDPENLNITSVTKMLNKRSRQRTKLFSFAEAEIADRTVSQTEFEAMGKYLSGPESYVIIESPNDSDGRWLYQKINEITSDRIKASFRSGPFSSVLIFQ